MRGSGTILTEQRTNAIENYIIWIDQKHSRRGEKSLVALKQYLLIQPSFSIRISSAPKKQFEFSGVLLSLARFLTN